MIKSFLLGVAQGLGILVGFVLFIVLMQITAAFLIHYGLLPA